MTVARSELVSPGSEGVFHCISMCVRRAFLCGEDPYDGRPYEHRREWIRERLKVLASAFGIEVCAYAVMSNHLHVVVRTRPDLVESWDDSADLACMMYVDLNPIRAGLAKTPEESEFTSAHERIKDRQGPKKKTLSKADSWLCPIEQVLPVTTDEYLDLLDWTGRQIAYGKRGTIPAHLAPILTRLEINDQRWLNTVSRFGSIFHRAAGRLDSMTRAAKETGLNWQRGLRTGRRAFSVA